MDFKKLTKKKRVYVIIILTLVGILLWAFFTARNITQDFNRKQVQGQENEQNAVVHGVILTETKNDKKYWEIYGDTGHWDGKTGIAQLNGVLANFYKDNKVSMSLKSAKGTYNSKTKVITLNKDILIVLESGITLRLDELTYTSSHDPIVGQGHVRIQKDKSLLSTAEKIIISPTYDNFRIIGNTVSKVYEDKK